MKMKRLALAIFAIGFLTILGCRDGENKNKQNSNLEEIKQLELETEVLEKTSSEIEMKSKELEDALKDL